MPIRTAFLACALIFAAGGPARAQTPEQIEAVARMLGWRPLGPAFTGGEVSDIAVAPGDASTFYVGTSGGLWKTGNAGTTFEPAFRGDTPRARGAAVGAVAVAPSDPAVVWLGTGEAREAADTPEGSGVYRSTDAGRSWAHAGLEGTQHIGRILVDPGDADVAYVAALGGLRAPSSERGVFRTLDGGQSWERVLFVDERTGAVDLAMDPDDSATLYAATYERQRHPWGLERGGPGSAVYRSTDGGATWDRLTAGWPSGDVGRIGLSAGPGRHVCALVEMAAGPADEPSSDAVGYADLYCSSAPGGRWVPRARVPAAAVGDPRVRIDASDRARVYVGAGRLRLSLDGGATFPAAGSGDAGASAAGGATAVGGASSAAAARTATAAAPDIAPRALWIDPADPRHLLLGGDGGLAVSWDRGAHWRRFGQLPIASVREVAVDAGQPYHVCGTVAGRGPWCVASSSPSGRGIGAGAWRSLPGSGVHALMDGPGGSVAIAGAPDGEGLLRVDLATGTVTALRPAPAADAAAAPARRWGATAPAVVSAHDDNTLYLGASVLLSSSDGGATWSALGPEPTSGTDAMGATHDRVGLGGRAGSVLTAIAESPLDSATLYTGSSAGQLHVSRDGGATWIDLTANLEGLPEHRRISAIVASHADAGTVYAAIDARASDDFAPYVYVSTNFGEEWRRIVQGLPDSPVGVLAQHPGNGRLLLAGTELGVWASLDGGGRWASVSANLPAVPIEDIEIQEGTNDLVVATRGAGIWIMDGIEPLAALTSRVVESVASVFPMGTAVLPGAPTPEYGHEGGYVAPSPPGGAPIRYWIGQGVDHAELVVTDPLGEVIRELDAPTRPGAHEVIWDLRLAESDAAGKPLPPGPRVLPGVYLVRMTAGNQVIESELMVAAAPGVAMNRGQLMARQQAMLDAYRLTAPLRAAHRTLIRLDAVLADAARLVADERTERPALAEHVDALRGEVWALGRKLEEASPATDLMHAIESVPAPPTAGQLRALDRAWDEVPALIARVNEIVTEEIPALHGRLDEAGIRPDPGAPVPLPRRGG